MNIKILVVITSSCPVAEKIMQLMVDRLIRNEQTWLDSMLEISSDHEAVELYKKVVSENIFSYVNAINSQAHAYGCPVPISTTIFWLDERNSPCDIDVIRNILRTCAN